MNTKYENSFWVFPEHANHNYPMIFGGAFFSEMDKAAATCVRRCLYNSTTCKDAVTYKVEDGVFHAPCYVGDLLYLEAEVIGGGKKSLVVAVKALRETEKGKQLVAQIKFVFVTLDVTYTGLKTNDGSLPYASHGLNLQETKVG